MSISATTQSISPVTYQSQVTPAGSIVSSSASSRTLTALPGGAVQVDDTFVRRSIIQPNNWASAPCAPAACQQLPAMQAPAAAAPAKKKKKKKGFGAKLKKGLRKAHSFGKKAIKTVGKVAMGAIRLPFTVLKATTGLDLDPFTMITRMMSPQKQLQSQSQ